MNETDRILFTTIDPTVNLAGKPIPAMTTLLHRVCDNDSGKFEEATRIVGLFIAGALTDVKRLHAALMRRIQAENCCQETGADCGVRGDGLPCSCSIEAKNDVETGN